MAMNGKNKEYEKKNEHQQQQQQHKTKKRSFEQIIQNSSLMNNNSRSNHSDQLDKLKKVLPEPPVGMELNARAQILEYTMQVIENLMRRATFLAVELAVASPDATSRWVKTCSSSGQKPFMYTVGSVMKLFAMRKDWAYGEWWTLDERQIKFNSTNLSSTTNHKNKKYKQQQQQNENENENEDDEDDEDDDEEEKPIGVMDDPGNVHGCVVRDTESVMRLAWTLVHRENENNNINNNNKVIDKKRQKQLQDLSEFAKRSKKFEFRPRIGMPGRVWSSRRPEWLTNLKDSDVFIRSPLATQFGMQTCLAVPIQFGGHVHSVMAFFSQYPRPFDSDSHSLACHLARCIEEVYSPRRPQPWITNTDTLFPGSIN